MRLSVCLSLIFALTPLKVSAQIPGAVFSKTCITESQLLEKFGSKPIYDSWRFLHDSEYDISLSEKLKFVKSVQHIGEITPYALHQFKRQEARVSEEIGNFENAANLYDWLSKSPSATKTERKTARAYAERLRNNGGFDELPPIKKLNFHFTESARQKNKSGFCIASFRINMFGHTENVELEYCSSRYFKKSMMKTVKSAEFDPRTTELGDQRMSIKMDFFLMDRCGNLLPK